MPLIFSLNQYLNLPRMKFLKLLPIFLFFVASVSHAQIKIDQITYKTHQHYITTTIGYPIDGIFLYEGKGEPIVELKANGTGIFQYEDLSKKNIRWGIECSQEGIPIFKEGYNSASYTLWYKPNTEEDWIYVQFSIHFNKKKMFIMGERIKTYQDSSTDKKSLSF
jgi:hypothetical protein